MGLCREERVTEDMGQRTPGRLLGGAHLSGRPPHSALCPVRRLLLFIGHRTALMMMGLLNERRS